MRACDAVRSSRVAEAVVRNEDMVGLSLSSTAVREGAAVAL